MVARQQSWRFMPKTSQVKIDEFVKVNFPLFGHLGETLNPVDVIYSGCPCIKYVAGLSSPA
jgi:hypothetical protein